MVWEMLKRLIPVDIFFTSIEKYFKRLKRHPSISIQISTSSSSFLLCWSLPIIFPSSSHHRPNMRSRVSTLRTSLFSFLYLFNVNDILMHPDHHHYFIFPFVCLYVSLCSVFSFSFTTVFLRPNRTFAAEQQS